MKHVIIPIRILTGVLAGLLFSVNAFCWEPEHKLTGFDHLIKVSESELVSFDAEKITGILNHITGGNGSVVKPEHPAGLETATFAYHGFDVDTDMTRLLKYAFNPDIPSCAVMPSEIRLSTWTDLNGKKINISPPLWSRLNHDQPSSVIHGMSYIQNTPESGTGAYFGYMSYKTVILLKYKGRNALISIMKQKDVSEVGKKGFPIGSKEAPDYYYSGEQGLTIRGLGWIKSYVYDSCSVSVFIERKDNEKGLKCGVFKWIRGGWAGGNIIRTAHAQKGLERFYTEFKNIMESKIIPAPEEIADTWNTISSLHHDDLKKKVENCLLSIKGRDATAGYSWPKALKTEAELGHYVNRMNHLEMSSALIADYMKHHITKSEKQGKVVTVQDPVSPKTN